MLSDLLETIHLHDVEAVLSSFTAPWKVRIPSDSAGFYYVNQGECRLQLDRSESDTVLCRGDLAVIAETGGHSICDDSARSEAPTARPSSGAIHPGCQNVPIAVAGMTTTLVCGRFAVGSEDWHPLLSALPSVIHIRNQDELFGTWLMDSLCLITQETEAYRSGGRNFLDHFAHLVFAHGVRAYIAVLPPRSGMQLKAVVDRKLGPALRLIHMHPEIPWSVGSLAREVGMSRASFAVSFTHLMRLSPMKYLWEFRMLKACKLLRESREGLKAIAARICYGSEAAFSNAFKRWAQTSPGRYRTASIPVNSTPITLPHLTLATASRAGDSQITPDVWRPR